MNVFKNIRNQSCNKNQGNLGEARAIYELTRLGFIVSKPLIENNKYDLIIDDNEKLNKVQVKTTRHKGDTGKFKVNLKTTCSNTKRTKEILRNKQDYDYLFILSEDNTCWLIPMENIEAIHGISLGKKYDKYILR